MAAVKQKMETAELKAKRLPKRLLYVLRYGALKEGLNVDSSGYVDVNELQKLNLLKCYTVDEILKDIQSSVSWRNVARYEWKERNKTTFVRAAYLRHFDPNPFHHGTKVKTLLESCMTYILHNLYLYDLEDFQDEYMIKRMIHRLKREKTVTSQALSTLFVPTLTRIDLEGIYLTNKTLKMLWTQCPHLRGISLKNCGYIITDTVLSQLVKNLPELEQLNLSRCNHLTDKCLPNLAKKLLHLKVLRLSGVPGMKPDSILKFMESAEELKFLDVFYMKTTFKEYNALQKCAKSKGIELGLQSPKVKVLAYKVDINSDDDDIYNEGNEADDDIYESANEYDNGEDDYDISNYFDDANGDGAIVNADDDSDYDNAEHGSIDGINYDDYEFDSD